MGLDTDLVLSMPCSRSGQHRGRRDPVLAREGPSWVMRGSPALISISCSQRDLPGQRRTHPANDTLLTVELAKSEGKPDRPIRVVRIGCAPQECARDRGRAAEGSQSSPTSPERVVGSTSHSSRVPGGERPSDMAADLRFTDGRTFRAGSRWGGEPASELGFNYLYRLWAASSGTGSGRGGSYTAAFDRCSRARWQAAFRRSSGCRC
jgi:hypothetical protein